MKPSNKTIEERISQRIQWLVDLRGRKGTVGVYTHIVDQIEALLKLSDAGLGPPKCN